MSGAQKTRSVFADAMQRKLGKMTTSLLLIVLVALVARLGYAWDQVRKMPDDLMSTMSFRTETGHIAYSIATGKGYASPFQRDTGPTAWLTPVYPLLVAGIFKIFGMYTRASFFAAVLLNILCSSAVCVPIYYAGKRIAGLGAGCGTAWLWAVFPNAVMIPTEWIWDTSLAALLAAMILWSTLELGECQRWIAWCWYGLLWGVTLMTNPALSSVFPLLLGWLAYHARRQGRLQLSRPAVAAAFVLLCCVPWTVRNFVVFHRFIPFRSNFGYELYIGNNENYDERRRGLAAVVTQDMETWRYLRMGETAFMEEEKRKALRFVASHPRVELWLIGNRIVDFWMGTAEPVKMFFESDSLLIRCILLGNLLSTVGAFAGVVALFFRRNVYAFPVAAFPVIFPLLYYATHTSLRYRHPIDPAVLLLTAIAMVGLSHRVFRRGLGPDHRDSVGATS